ncbi:MAG: prevent-host-death protein [Xenococcaceae cyanobacterium]
MIYKNNQPVAVVINAETFQEFLTWREQHHQPSLADALAELRGLCIDENYTFEIPVRQNRPNPFANDLNQLPL